MALNNTSLAAGLKTALLAPGGPAELLRLGLLIGLPLQAVSKIHNEKHSDASILSTIGLRGLTTADQPSMGSFVGWLFVALRTSIRRLLTVIWD